MLDDLASFFGAASELYWLHRDWAVFTKLPESHTVKVRTEINDLLANLIHYCVSQQLGKRSGHVGEGLIKS